MMPCILASVAYGLKLAFCHLDIPGVCWSGWQFVVCLFCPWVASGLQLGLCPWLYQITWRGFPLAVVDLVEGLQTVGYSIEQSSYCPTVLSAADPQLLWVQRVLNFSTALSAVCPTALSAEGLLECIRIWSLLGSRPTIGLPQQPGPAGRFISFLSMLSLTLWAIFFL